MSTEIMFTIPLQNLIGIADTQRMLFYSKEDTAWILSRAVPFKETKTLLSIKLILSFIFGIPGKDYLLTARCIRVRMIPLCLQLLTAIALAVIRIGTDYFAIAAMRSNLLGKFLLLPAKEHLRQAQLGPKRTTSMIQTTFLRYKLVPPIAWLLGQTYTDLVELEMRTTLVTLWKQVFWARNWTRMKSSSSCLF